MKENLIKIKSFKLAVEVVNLYKKVVENKKEFNLSKQLVKSGTSIGANVREGINAQSKADFINKFNVALKESSETLYWLELLKETEYISEEEFEKIYKKADEVHRIIFSIVKTSKENL